MIFDRKLKFEMTAQPDAASCGPTCLYSVYRYYRDRIRLDQVIREVPQLQSGGTLAVQLACHALRRGYASVIYTYNLQLFDPTWFPCDSRRIQEKLLDQAKFKKHPDLQAATVAYQEFFGLGGTVRFEDLTAGLLRKYLNRSIPILTGLSSTYLYRTTRYQDSENVPDEIRGVSDGHFVVLRGYNRLKREVLVSDPYRPNPFSGSLKYRVGIDRLVGAILLGVLTYDACFLIITPKK